MYKRQVSAVCSGAVIEFTPSGLGYPNNCVIYQSVSTPGCITTCVSYSPINVTGLTNCQSYTFEIRAHNPTGWGAYSASSGAVVPHPSPSVPGIPSICSSTAGCSSVSVCFSPPNSIGYPCHPITYQVISVPGCISVIGSSSPINICGLTNCQNYTFKIRAHNPTGWGAYSAAGGAAMPHPAPTVPGAPSITGGTAGCSSAAISFNPPSSFGYPNHPITYQVISSPDGIAATGSSSPINVTGLTNCQSYTFRVRANNPTGWGEYSTASSATIPHPPPSIPGVPSVTTGTAGCTSASVSFTPSGTLGYPCHPITFEVVSVPGCISSTGSTSPINVVGLTNCQSYTFKARAHNPTGYSAFSVAGGATMPHPPPAAPGAPTIGTASITNCSTTATITFTTGTSGYPATCLTYQVISVPGNITACGSASPICVPGLTVCTPYQFKVRGHNPTGWGCYSGLSNSITPIVVPYSWSSSGANITMIPYGSGDQYLIAAVSQSILSSNPWKTVVEGGSGGPVTVASGSSFFPVSKGILNGSTRYTGFWYAHVTIASQDNTYINVKSYVAVIADAIANNQYTGPIPTI